MQPIELSTQHLQLPAQRGALPPLTHAGLIVCLAALAHQMANNAEADTIIDTCYAPPLAQKPLDSIPPLERAS